MLATNACFYKQYQWRIQKFGIGGGRVGGRVWGKSYAQREKREIARFLGSIQKFQVVA